MHAPHNLKTAAVCSAVFWLALLSVLPVGAAQADGSNQPHGQTEATPPAPPKPASPAKSSVKPAAPAGVITIPDYGGRESGPLAVTDTAPNPAAQAGRALEALVVVLAGVVGVVYALKRFGLVKPGENGRPSRIVGPAFGRTAAAASAAAGGSAGLTVVSSQTLPGGTMLHVVRVGEKDLLLAATAHTVTSVAEWPAALTLPETKPLGRVSEFEEYLTRADPTSGIAAANARLRSLLSPMQPEEDS